MKMKTAYHRDNSWDEGVERSHHHCKSPQRQREFWKCLAAAHGTWGGAHPAPSRRNTGSLLLLVIPALGRTVGRNKIHRAYELHF